MTPVPSALILPQDLKKRCGLLPKKRGARRRLVVLDT
jgi:hypothetical protein